MKRGKPMRKIKDIMKVVLTVLVLGMLIGMPAAASDEAASGSGKQWVFLLPDAEEAGAYIMFARPSLAGLAVDEDMSIRAALRFEDEALELDKSYEILLLPVKGNGQWLASDTIVLADRALEIDGQVSLDIYQGDSVQEHFETDLSELLTDWPKTKAGRLRLEKGKNGALKTREFEIDQWIEPSEDPLFTYTIEDEESCKVSYSSDKLTIEQAERGGHFAIAVSDPAGNRRTVMVELASIKEAVSPVVIVIPLIIAAVIILFVLLGRRRAGRENKLMKDLLNRINSRQIEIENTLSNARNVWFSFETARNTAERKAREGDPECTMTLDEINAAAAEAGDLKEINAYSNLESANKTLLRLKDIVMARLGNNQPHDAGDKALLEEYLDEDKAAAAFDNIAVNISNLRAITDEVSKRTGTLEMTAVPFAHSVRFHVILAGDPQPWEGMIVAGTGMCHLDQFPLVRPREHTELSNLLDMQTGLQAFSMDPDKYRVRVKQGLSLALPDRKLAPYVDIAYIDQAELQIRDGSSVLCDLIFDEKR